MQFHEVVYYRSTVVYITVFYLLFLPEERSSCSELQKCIKNKLNNNNYILR